jgi:hypothetical protein
MSQDCCSHGALGGILGKKLCHDSEIKKRCKQCMSSIYVVPAKLQINISYSTVPFMLTPYYTYFNRFSQIYAVILGTCTEWKGLGDSRKNIHILWGKYRNRPTISVCKFLCWCPFCIHVLRLWPFLTKWSLPDMKRIQNGILRHIYKICFCFFEPCRPRFALRLAKVL